MLERLHIQNYRSILDATVDLQPFTLLVGANGSGKSNLLKLLADLSKRTQRPQSLTPHFRAPTASPSVAIIASGAQSAYREVYTGAVPEELRRVSVFSIDPVLIGGSEELKARPEVQPNGSGAIQVLDALKTGDREDLFDTIERRLHEFVPEIEKLSFVPGAATKSLQVRELGIPVPVPVRELSEGTRLVLTILTIVYQERKPSIICLEDLDRGLHPALFGKVVEVCRDLVRGEGAPQIIATTHNPYFVDQFVDDETSVILVEKMEAATTFTTLAERMKGLDRGADTLGGVWYSGLVGGAPVRPAKHVRTDPSAEG